MVKMYQRRRYIVKGVQWTGDNIDEVKQFLKDNFTTVMGVEKFEWSDRITLMIQTLDKTYYIGSGEMIAKYPDGELAISKKDVFDKIFEEVKELAE